MAVVRPGEDGSEVYIYVTESSADEMYLRCAGCPAQRPMVKRIADRLRRRRVVGIAAGPEQMRAHVRWHRTQGDVVPDWVDDEIETEWKFCAAGTSQ